MSPRPSIPIEQVIADRYVKAAGSNCAALARLEQSIDKLEALVNQLTDRRTNERTTS